MRLRQVNTPANQASWKEYFYSGELNVVNGETETDNPIWIEHLLLRGFKPLDEIPQNVQVLGMLKTEKDASSQQEVSQEPVRQESTQEALKEEARTQEEFPEETIKDVPSEEDSSEMEEVPPKDTLLADLLKGKTPTRTPRPPRRKNVK